MNSLHLKLFNVDCTDNTEVVESTFKIIEGLGLHVRNSLQHNFHPQGLTFTVIFSESHGVVSTWPELRELQLDLFVCGENSLSIVSEAIKKAKEVFNASFFKCTVLDRQSMSVSVWDEGGGADVMRLRF